MLKTRLELLEEDHNSAYAQLIENEINVATLTRKSSELKPGKEYDDLQKILLTKKTNIERISEVLKTIKDLISKEKNVIPAKV